MIATAEAERRLFEIVRRHFTKAPVLEPSTRLRDDLGADSLDLVELMFDVEQEFGVEISDAQVVEIQTLGDALALLQKDAV